MEREGGESKEIDGERERERRKKKREEGVEEESGRGEK